MPKIVSAGVKAYARDAVAMVASGLLSYSLPIIPLGPIVGHYLASEQHRTPVDIVDLAVWLDAFIGQFTPGGIIR